MAKRTKKEIEKFKVPKNELPSGIQSKTIYGKRDIPGKKSFFNINLLKKGFDYGK